MFSQIFGAGQEGAGQSFVLAGITAAANGSGQHSASDEITGSPNQQFGCGTHQPGHLEGPATRVGLSEPLEQQTRIEGSLDGGDHVSGQHHLVQFAATDAIYGAGNCLLPLRFAQRPIGPLHGRRCLHTLFELIVVELIVFHPAVVLPVRVRGLASFGVHRRDPGLPGALADQHLGHDHFGGISGIESKRGKGDGATAWHAYGVVDQEPITKLRPPALGSRETLHAADLQFRRDPPTHESLTTTQPTQPANLR